MNDNSAIKIFDTTLRDGEQSPGASMNLAEKMEIAQALVDLGVDVIEAGFPIASPGDFEAVKEIASNIRGASICGLARCNERDITRAWEALKHSSQPRIHIFLATSAIHREFKLKMTPDEIIRRAVESVTLAANLCDDIEFSPEDAVRTEPDFLCRVVEAAIAAGATTVNIPDTVGYATPTHMHNTAIELTSLTAVLEQQFDHLFGLAPARSTEGKVLLSARCNRLTITPAFISTGSAVKLGHCRHQLSLDRCTCSQLHSLIERKRRVMPRKVILAPLWRFH